MRDKTYHRKRLLALLLFAPMMAGCAGSVSDMFQSDLLSKDAEWFSRSGRLFIRNVSIETPPLTPNKQLGPEDYVTAEGFCPGMTPPGAPAGANALADGAAAAPPPSTTGTVALGHTECDVVRGIGAPDSVNLSRNERGDRLSCAAESGDQVAAGFFLALGFAIFGSTTACGFRSIDVRRPDVKV